MTKVASKSLTIPEPLTDSGSRRAVFELLDKQRPNAQSELSEFRKENTEDTGAKPFRMYAIGKIGETDPTRAQKSELEIMHRVERSRSDADTATAKWYAEYGVHDIWVQLQRDWGKSQTKADAERGAAILSAAFKQTNSVVSKLKKDVARERPYVVDDTLTPVKTRFKLDGHASFPSLHAAMSAAGGTVMEALDPAHKKQYRALANDTAFSRVYGGYHFPADIAAGARAGVMSAMHALSELQPNAVAKA